MDVANILFIKYYKINDKEKNGNLLKNWQGRERLQFIQTLATSERETCGTVKGLFDTLS